MFIKYFPESRSKRAIYNFHFNNKAEIDSKRRINPPFELKLETNQDPNLLIKKNPIQELLKLEYQIQVFKFQKDEDNRVFVWIDGSRCRWICNRKSRTCGEKYCWNEPSFCYGELLSCLKKDDGVNLCSNLDDNDKHDDNKDTFIINSIDIGEYFDRGIKDSIVVADSGYTDHTPWYIWEWKCDQFENEFLCHKSKGIGAPSVGLLKTIAG